MKYMALQLPFLRIYFSTYTILSVSVISLYCIYVASLSTFLFLSRCITSALCQAVIQVLLSMRSHRLADTPIQYRYIPDNSTISVLRFSIIRHIREIEIYLFHSNFRALDTRWMRTQRFTRCLAKREFSPLLTKYILITDMMGRISSFACFRNVIESETIRFIRCFLGAVLSSLFSSLYIR